MKPLLLGLLLALCGLGTALYANNLVISTPTVVGANLQFTISWDNSWNTNVGPANWDAVWVFVKRQNCTNNLWSHALVSTISANHSVTGGVLQVDAVPDGMGVFIRRSALGNGNIAASTVTLALQTAANGVDNFQVIGIEMVAVPQGDFFIGDGTRGTNNWGFITVLITSAVQAAGIGAAGNYGGLGSTGALPATYPLGWNNFYLMKYEISQEQFVSFLNSLTYAQQVSRIAVSPSSGAGTLAIASAATPQRNRIEIQSPGVANITPAVFRNDLNNNGVYNESGDGQDIACNWLSWRDLMAYLDWAALRPMTEFEYEKATRGAAATVTPNEYPWGSVTILQAESGALLNAGQSSEVSTASGNGLCAFNAGNTAKGPLRCGFAAGAATTKAQAGSSYYGAMDMAGNVNEQCVGGHNFNYSAFTTANGDGTLTATGAADVTGWPVTGGGANGGIVRGGDWFNGSNLCQVSDRGWLGSDNNQGRNGVIGGRGVRSF